MIRELIIRQIAFSFSTSKEFKVIKLTIRNLLQIVSLTNF